RFAVLQHLLDTYCFLFLFTSYGVHRDLHSFPTRRSSDLTYWFDLEGTSEIQGRKNYIIRYIPKKNKQDVGIPGLLYIDAQSYAIQRNESKLDASIEVQAIQEYQYFPDHKLWFPSANKIQVDKGTSDK